MKAIDVMKRLNILRTTLYNYTKFGTLKSTKLDNGYYEYDEDSVLAYLKKDNRQNVIYARVSTPKQKDDLQRQIKSLEKYASNNNIKIDDYYFEISSGVDLDRKELNRLIDDVIHLKIKNVIISHKDRLTR